MSDFPSKEHEPNSPPVGYVPRKPLQPPKENGFGIAGFITSVVGLIACGSISIFAVILSAIGLRKEPRGLAVAGLIMGLIGIVELVAVILVVFIGVRTTTVAVGGLQKFAVEQMLAIEAVQVGAKWQQNDQLPTQAEGDDLLAGKMDVWGNQIEYETDGFGFSLRSTGPDGIPQTSDDITVGPFTDADAAQETSFGPGFEPGTFDLKEFEGIPDGDQFNLEIDKMQEEIRSSVQEMQDQIQKDVQNPQRK